MTGGLLVALLACAGPVPTETGALDTGEPPSDDSTAVDRDSDGDGSPASLDCDDDNAAVNPGATEVCNGIDDDCDSTIDVGADDALSLYPDADGDGYGALVPIATCDPKAGIPTSADCDDANPNVNPAVDCDDPFDGVDNDCDGEALEIPVAYDVVGSTDSEPDEFQTADSGPVALRIVSTSTQVASDMRYVHVEATKPMILVLSSGREIDWIVDETIPGTVQRIVLSSEYESTATGPAGTPIDAYVGSRQELFRYGGDWDILTTRTTEEVLLDTYGIPVTSWIDHVSFEEITIRDGDAWPNSVYEYPNPGCPVQDEPFTAPDTSGLPTACDPILAKGETVCLSTTTARTVLFDVEGDMCVVADTGFDSGDFYASLAWLGGYLYGIADEQVVRLRLSDGQLERSYVYAEYGVFDQSLGLYTVAEGDWGAAILRYESWHDLLHGFLSENLPGHLISSTYSARDDVIWSAYSSTSFLWRLQTVSPKGSLPDIALEGFNATVGAFDVTDDDLLVLRERPGTTTIVHVFDIEGNAVRTFDIGADDAGVACFTP